MEQEWYTLGRGREKREGGPARGGREEGVLDDREEGKGGGGAKRQRERQGKEQKVWTDTQTMVLFSLLICSSDDEYQFACLSLYLSHLINTRGGTTG